MKKAFTMIELLVVIGIIGILMAVLIGTFSGSSESARSAKCLANMHTLAMAVQGYVMETSNYPYAGTVTKKDQVAGQGWIGWATANSTDVGGSYCSPTESNRDKRRYSLTNGVIYAALHGATGAYVCPSHLVACRKKKNMADPLWSYVMNGSFGWDKSKPFNPVGQTDLTRPERKLLFAELPFLDTTTDKKVVVQKGNIDAGASETTDPILQYDGITGGGSETIGINHKVGSVAVGHVCFCDGHIDKLRFPSGGNEKNRLDLTKWLCVSSDDDGEFDVTYDEKSKLYKQLR